MSIIELKNVEFKVNHLQHEIDILSKVQLSVGSGESIAIVGNSGSGKSSLLSIMAGFQEPSAGEIITHYDNKLTTAKHGFIFQDFNLVPGLDSLQNVMLPQLIAGTYDESKALSCLRDVGMEHRANHYPKTLSGGEKQRIAIARAIATQAPIIFADEPTGNLDTSIGKVIEDLLLNLVKEKQIALTLVTHNKDFALRCDRVYKLQDGTLSAYS